MPVFRFDLSASAFVLLLIPRPDIVPSSLPSPVVTLPSSVSFCLLPDPSTAHLCSRDLSGCFTQGTAFVMGPVLSLRSLSRR